jgi:hypothetical protein
MSSQFERISFFLNEFGKKVKGIPLGPFFQTSPYFLETGDNIFEA